MLKNPGLNCLKPALSNQEAESRRAGTKRSRVGFPLADAVNYSMTVLHLPSKAPRITYYIIKVMGIMENNMETAVVYWG